MELAGKATAAPVFAVLSAIHGNLAALEAVLEYLDARAIRSAICLGDIVGYGPHPIECIRMLRERDIPCLRGNHEEGTLSDRILTDLSSEAIAGILYARRVISKPDLDFLRSLPDAFVFPELAFVHAAFPQPEDFDYICNCQHAEVHLNAQPAPVSFFGHTHRQGGFRRKLFGASEISSFQPVEIGAGETVAFNPGSVGQPRDGDLRAALLVYDTRSRKVEFLRVDYDIDTTVRAITQAGLPPRLGRRLRSGR